MVGSILFGSYQSQLFKGALSSDPAQNGESLNPEEVAKKLPGSPEPAPAPAPAAPAAPATPAPALAPAAPAPEPPLVSEDKTESVPVPAPLDPAAPGVPAPTIPAPVAPIYCSHITLDKSSLSAPGTTTLNATVSFSDGKNYETELAWNGSNGTFEQSKTKHQSNSPFQNTFTAKDSDANMNVKVSSVAGAENSEICTVGIDIQSQTKGPKVLTQNILNQGSQVSLNQSAKLTDGTVPGLNETKLSNENQTPSDTKSTQESALSPGPDTMTCTMISPLLALSSRTDINVGCTLKFPLILNAQIVNGNFKPSEQIDKEKIVKYLVYNKSTSNKLFTVSWDGRDNYDSPVEPGDYSFVVWGKISATDMADYSIHKFKVVQNAPPAEVKDSGEKIAANGTPIKSSQNPPADPQASQGTPKPPTQSTPITSPTPNPTTSQAPQGTPSQCPGVNYPNDIENYPGKELIKKAFDGCFLKGYTDGTFRPNQPLTRAEAVKTVMLASGKKPYSGCKDPHCGANYQVRIWDDIDALWQGEWIRPAADTRIVQGYKDYTFRPNQWITRAEAAKLITKAFGIPRHEGCYTPDCGAGYPDNVFFDIKDFWQGPFIRALWDKKIATGIAPHKYEPNRPITRGEIAIMISRAK